MAMKQLSFPGCLGVFFLPPFYPRLREGDTRARAAAVAAVGEGQVSVDRL